MMTFQEWMDMYINVSEVELPTADRREGLRCKDLVSMTCHPDEKSLAAIESKSDKEALKVIINVF